MTTRFLQRSLFALAAWIVCAAAAQAGGNLIKDGSFEKPVVPDGSYVGYATGDTITKSWSVVGAAGVVDLISTDFTQNGFSFPARTGAQWLDLTGTSNTPTGVQQMIKTVPGATYRIGVAVGNVYDPKGIFGISSTVDVLVDGEPIAAFTNSGRSKKKLKWRKFSTEFTAQGSKTTIAFLTASTA
jgi:hypothetical protein